MHVPFSSNQEHRYASQNSGAYSLSKLARCRRPNMPCCHHSGLTPTTSPVDINAYQCAHGHIHEAMLRKTVEQTGAILEGTLHGCKRCSMEKGLRKPISRSTHVRADKKFGRVFVDLSGPKQVESKGRNRWVMIVRVDYSRFM